MESIPQEIHDEIFNQIVNLSDLLSLRSVSRAFRAKFTPATFKTVSFVNNSAGRYRFRGFITSGLSQYVNDLSLTLDNSYLPQEQITLHTLGNQHSSTLDPTFLTFLNTFNNVRSLTLSFRGTDDPYNRWRIQSIILDGIARNAATFSPISLTIQRLYITTTQIFEWQGFLKVLGRLTSLSIDIANPPEQNESSIAYTKLMHMWLPPAQASLETLVLSSTRYLSDSSQPGDLAFANLQRLELVHIIFFETGFIRAIIGSPRVATTLQVLRLSGCACYVDEQIGEGERWAEVFSMFRLILRLRRFEVGEMLTYCRSQYIVGAHEQSPFLELQRPSLMYQRDRVELNRLWESIGQKESVEVEDRIAVGYSYT